MKLDMSEINKFSKLFSDDTQILVEIRKLAKLVAATQYDIKEIKNDIKEINMKLNAVNEAKKNKFSSWSKFNLPLTSQAEIDQLECKIENGSSDDLIW